MGQSHNTGFTDFKKQGFVGVTYRKKIERKWWVVGLVGSLPFLTFPAYF